MIKINYLTRTPNSQALRDLLIGALFTLLDGESVYMKVSAPYSMVDLGGSWSCVRLATGQMYWIKLEQPVIELDGELIVKKRGEQ